MNKRSSIPEIAAALALLQVGKVQIVKKTEPVKSKFLKVLPRRHDAAPGAVRELEKSDRFQELCTQNEIPATHRQASKFLQKRGRLFTATKGQL